MAIDYLHAINQHSLRGPQTALPAILDVAAVSSLLDVGCGTGPWMKAAMELGIQEVFGLDGVAAPLSEMLVPTSQIQVQDLTKPWDLGRRFDAILCLEVAEHLDARWAEPLIHALARHSDLIVFSAACPGQPGQHHVNCRWPDYWQGLFNTAGFVCSDAARWRLWNEERIEPWYRQNLFVARRDLAAAGQEQRIKPVIHPQLVPLLETHWRQSCPLLHVREIEKGALPLSWYGVIPFRGILSKLRRRTRMAKED